LPIFVSVIVLSLLLSFIVLFDEESDDEEPDDEEPDDDFDLSFDALNPLSL
jgi:hypothetical protein